jgi:hypothetical protein
MNKLIHSKRMGEDLYMPYHQVNGIGVLDTELRIYNDLDWSIHLNFKRSGLANIAFILLHDELQSTHITIIDLNRIEKDVKETIRIEIECFVTNLKNSTFKEVEVSTTVPYNALCDGYVARKLRELNMDDIAYVNYILGELTFLGHLSYSEDHDLYTVNVN